MRKLATIRKISGIDNIEGADRIQLVHIDGWQCVVGKDQFKVGEEVVFFEIDSALPVDDARYDFLKERCLKQWMNHGELILETIRIKTIKLRGVVSQGLVLPLSGFPELQHNFVVGDDVTEELRVKHYDELAEKCGRIQGVAKISGNAKGNFPTHLCPKSDEERLQNLTEYFDGRMSGIEFEATEKADGSSMTVIFAPKARPEDPFFVCSRNLELKDELNNEFWNMVRKYDILNKMRDYCVEVSDVEQIEHQLAIQMEMVGPGINKNRDQYQETEIRVFRMFDIDKQQWINSDNRIEMCKQLGLPHVKVLKKDWKVFDEFKTMEDFLEFVKGKTDHGFEREGVVFKSKDGNIHFKVINNEYLLKDK